MEVDDLLTVLTVNINKILKKMGSGKKSRIRNEGESSWKSFCRADQPYSMR